MKETFIARQKIVNRMLEVAIQINREIWYVDDAALETLYAEWNELKAELDRLDLPKVVAEPAAFNVTMDGIVIRENIDAERLAKFIKRLEFDGGRQRSENVYISQFGSVVKIVPIL